MDKLVSWGLVDGTRAEGGKPLAAHLADWKQSLIASGCSEKHIGAGAGADLLGSLRNRTEGQRTALAQGERC